MRRVTQQSLHPSTSSTIASPSPSASTTVPMPSISPIGCYSPGTYIATILVSCANAASRVVVLIIQMRWVVQNLSGVTVATMSFDLRVINAMKLVRATECIDRPLFGLNMVNIQLIVLIIM